MSTSICAEESFNLLNAGAKLHWRGQGDTWTAARDRAAKEAGVTPAQAERLQKNWKSMRFPNGDVYRLLRNKYGHLCSWIEAKADAIDREAQQIEEANAADQGAAQALRGVEAETRRAAQKEIVMAKASKQAETQDTYESMSVRNPKRDREAEKAAEAPATPPVQNSTLTPEERSALRMHHIRQLLKVEADMKPLRDLRKKIRADAKGDGFKLTEIDAGIRLATMDDQSIFVAEIKELIEIAQSFNALPPGGQGDLFPDRRPKDEQRFAEGKQAGLEGKNPEPPYGADSVDGQAWMRGWHEGQRIMREDLASAMEKRNAKADADELIKSGDADEPFPEAAE